MPSPEVQDLAQLFVQDNQLVLLETALTLGLAFVIGIVMSSVPDLQLACGPVVARRDPEAVRRKFNDRGSLLMVHAGGINPERDLETLIRAAAIMSQSTPVRLVVAGSGDGRCIESLKRRCRDLGLAESVAFFGQVPLEDARALMALATIGVVTLQANPLREVALPNRVLSLATLGKPLILSNLPLLRRMFEGGAYFYAAGDPGDFAARIREAWSNNGESHGRAAVASGIAESISAPRMAERPREVYANLAA